MEPSPESTPHPVNTGFSVTALQMFRDAMVRHVRAAFERAYGDQAVARFADHYKKAEWNELTQRQRERDVAYRDEFELLEIAKIWNLIESKPDLLLPNWSRLDAKVLKRRRRRVQADLESLTQLRNAAHHSPEGGLTARQVKEVFDLTDRLLREFELIDTARELAELRTAVVEPATEKRPSALRRLAVGALMLAGLWLLAIWVAPARDEKAAEPSADSSELRFNTDGVPYSRDETLAFLREAEGDRCPTLIEPKTTWDVRLAYVEGDLSLYDDPQVCVRQSHGASYCWDAEQEQHGRPIRMTTEALQSSSWMVELRDRQRLLGRWTAPPKDPFCRSVLCRGIKFGLRDPTGQKTATVVLTVMPEGVPDQDVPRLTERCRR